MVFPTFMAILLVLCAVLMVGSVILLVRNEAVYRFRSALLQEMMDRVTGGADPDVTWDELRAFQAVDYKTMVFKFWKPLNNREWFEGTALDR